jgi:hypothetical protein
MGFLPVIFMGVYRCTVSRASFVATSGIFNYYTVSDLT